MESRHPVVNLSVGLDVELLVLSNADTRTNWLKHARTHKLLWLSRHSVRPILDIWDLSDMRAHALAMYASAGALEAMSSISCWSLPQRHRIARSFAADAHALQLAALAAAEYGYETLRGSRDRGMLHITDHPEQLTRELARTTVSVSEAVEALDAWGRNAVHAAALRNLTSDVVYLASVSTASASHRDAFGLNPADLIGEGKLALAAAGMGPSKSPSEAIEVKVSLLGDHGVGKTAFVERHRTGVFKPKYISSVGVEVTAVRFETNKGRPIVFNVWDCGCSEKWGGLRDGYYLNARAGILMFDLTSRFSYRNVGCWHRDFTRVIGDVPVVLCGNKADLSERAVPPKRMTFHRKKGLRYCEISAQSTLNIEQPFLYLAQQLLGPDTEFVLPESWV